MGKHGYILLSLYCILLFGYSLIGGRPLTMHEARLPQTTREMVSSGNWHDWIVPKSGGRPWVERPPLPHWITAAITAPFGGIDTVWKARIPSALAGLFCTLLLASMTSRLFGRQTGILTGFIQATTFEFFSYSWLAEDDIFLALIIYSALAVFVKLEFSDKSYSSHEQETMTLDEGETKRKESINPLGKRPFLVLLLFFLLGLTNMAKGLVFGTVMALIPIAGFLLSTLDWRRIMRYIWLPGWILFALTAAWWPYVAEQLSPGSYDVWHYDLFGRLNKGYLAQPWYYYLENLPGIIAPWTPFCLLGLGVSFMPMLGGDIFKIGHLSRKETGNKVPSIMICAAMTSKRAAQALRFVWAWAVLTIIVFSLSQSKHHHYLLHVTGAWAILGAIGLRWFWEKLANLPKIITNPLIGLVLAIAGLSPLWILKDKLELSTNWLTALSIFIICAVFLLFFAMRARKSALALTAFLLGFAGIAAFFYSFVAPKTDQTIEDTKFLQAVKDHVPADAPLLINAHPRGGMDFFREMFYLPEQTVLLHNETYLMQDKYISKTIYLVDRSSQEQRLAAFGSVTIILQSKHSRREEEHAGKLTLYKIQISKTLKTFPRLPVNPMQAMSREDGPYLNQQLPEKK